MKKVILILVVTTTLIAGITFPGFRSSTHIQKADLTNVFVKQEMNGEQNAATSEEWITFKYESDLKIKNNEFRIAELNLKLKNPAEPTDAHYKKNIANLEQQNKYMKARLENYEKNPCNWQSFMRGFNNEMDVIGNNLKNLTIDNKK